MALLLGHFQPGLFLRRASYDLMHSFPAHPSLSWEDSEVVMLLMDMDSHLNLGQRMDRRWDRRLHAGLIDRLAGAGARRIVFDVLFTEPGPDPEADKALAEAISRAGNVVLAAELERSASGSSLATHAESLTLVVPWTEFTRASADWGTASLIVDEDLVVRRLFLGLPTQNQPSLASAAVAGALPGPVAEGPDPWIRYYGRPLSIPHMSYYLALEGLVDAARSFTNKIVFVGARPMAGSYAQRRDEFRGPISSWHRDVRLPGVEIQATQALNLIRGDWLVRFPSWIEVLTLGLVSLGVVLGPARLGPVGCTVFSGTLLVITLVTAGAFFRWGQVWFPWLIVAAFQIPSGLTANLILATLNWSRARKELERKRQEAEQRVRDQAALIDKARDAILIRSLDGAVLFGNPSAERLYGWSQTELRSPEASDAIFSPSNSMLPECLATLLERGEWTGDLEQVSRTGAKLVVESRWTLLRSENGEPPSVLMINTDVTEKRAMQAGLMRAQRLEVAAALAAGMAHDLNNALSPVLLGVQKLRQNHEDPETRRLLGIIERSTRRGAEMVRQVKAVTRPGDEKQPRMNPQEVLEEIEAVITHAFPSGIVFSLLLPGDLWTIEADPTQFHQVLMNLCLNARDAMEGKGDLTVAADNVTLDAIEASGIPGGRQGDFVMTAVADTGPGIDPVIASRLFDAFYTTKLVEGGTGLGLAIASGIVKTLGGFICLRSELGQGACFEVYWPRSKAAPVPSPVRRSNDLRGCGERILIISHEQGVVEALSAALIDHGYVLVVANSSIEGSAILSRDLPLIDLVLFDASADQGLESAFLDHLVEIARSVPVIVLTGTEKQVELLHEGIRFLDKPTPLQILLSELKHAISSPPETREVN